MTKALFYQPSSGISGDMHLAALLDLGVPIDHLQDELARLPVACEFSLQVEAAGKMGIHGTRVKVHTTDTHDHRHHSTIIKLIETAGFSEAITARALGMFAAIAAAEGKIHNIPPEKVHFHEVGAVDSIVDIVGAAIAIEYLAPEVVVCNPVEVGGGYVDCAHGRFPVPAPATQELLAGVPCTYGGVSSESTTPTGAAILASTVHEFEPRGAFSPTKVGYGIGHKDFERPNVLRAVLGEYHGTSAPLPNVSVTEQFTIETNLDDMSPEGFEPLMQALFSAGAVDVFYTPIVMKKSRPAYKLSALSPEEHVQSVAAALLNQSSTLGLRITPFKKYVLDREFHTLTTSLGKLRIKQVQQPNGLVRWKVESDDIRQLAAEQQMDYAEVQRRMNVEVANLLKDDG